MNITGNEKTNEKVNEKTISLQSFFEKNNFFGETGSMIKGTVVQGGKNPVVDFNGTKVAVKSDVLSNAQPGKELDLKVQQEDGNKVVLQIMNDYLSEQGERVSSHSTETQVVRNTEQFVSMLETYDPNVAIVNGNMEAAHNLGVQISSADVEKLRQMGINISSGNIGHLISFIQEIHIENEKERIYPEETQKNMDEMVEKAKEFGPVSDGELSAIISNKENLSYQNMYEARYSGSNEEKESNFSESEWKELKPQVESLLQREGLEVTDDNVNAGKWMLKHGQEISAYSIQLYQDAMNYNEKGINEEQYRHNLEESKNYSERLEQASVIGLSYGEKASRLISQANEITEEVIDKAVLEGRPNTIQAYIITMKEENKGEGDTKENNKEELSPEQQSKAEKAKLQLERIRLQMTEQASRSMLARKIPIDTTDLKELVEQLEEENTKYYKGMLEAHQISATKENIQQLQENISIISQIPTLPVNALGMVVNESVQNGETKGQVTLLNVHEKGNDLARQYQQAGEQYETMGTQIRSDLGDSIQKAFNNLPSLLEELNIENTNENQKAARILAYNQMEISEENIQRITTLDRNLISIVNGLKPEIVMDFIKEGTNPIDMTFAQLQEEITKKEESLSASEEKYSEFLHELDKKGNISEQERSSFIGVYRLLHTVTRYSDRELGALVKSGQELTLDNLLTAYESRKAQGMDISMDESFGMLSQVKYHGDTIRSQVESGFQESKQENLQYAKSVCESLYSNISVEGVGLAFENENVMQISLERLEEIFENTPKQPEDASVKEKMQEQYLQQLQEIGKVSEKVVRKMNAWEITMTPDNIQMTTTLVEQSGETFSQMKKLLLGCDLKEEKVQDILKQYKEDILNGEEESASQRFTENINQELHRDQESYIITREQMAARRQVHTAVNILRTLEQSDNYLVPVSVNGQVVAVSLSIKDEGKQEARIEIEIPLKDMELRADIQVGANAISGIVSGSSEQLPAWTENSIAKLKESVQKIDPKNKRQLLQVAKTFLEMVEN